MGMDVQPFMDPMPSGLSQVWLHPSEDNVFLRLTPVEVTSRMSQSTFQPTHVLVSRSRQVPIQLIPCSQGAALLTEAEWKNGQAPAFSLHPKRGFFCHDIQVLGYRLEPIQNPVEAVGVESLSLNHSRTA